MFAVHMLLWVSIATYIPVNKLAEHLTKKSRHLDSFRIRCVPLINFRSTNHRIRSHAEDDMDSPDR